LIKIALTMGISFFQVFFFETVFASIFFLFFVRSFFRGARPRSILQWLGILALGIDTIGVGYFLFLSFSLGPVAIGATLMFMYLPVVYAYSLITGHQTFSIKKIFSIGLILFGASLTTEIITSIHQPGVLPAVFAAIVASMCYSVVFILTPAISTYTTPLFRSFSASMTGLIGSAVILLIKTDLWFPIPDDYGSLLVLILILGFIGQTLPVITLMKGLPITGSSLGGVLASVELPIAVFSAALILGESVNASKVIGVILVLTGIISYNFWDKKS
jgi:drug/metabolite transporter (DMT)-like permease